MKSLGATYKLTGLEFGKTVAETVTKETLAVILKPWLDIPWLIHQISSFTNSKKGLPVSYTNLSYGCP